MSFVSFYLYVPDEGSLVPKYRDCTTSNDIELYIYIYSSKSLDVVQSLYSQQNKAADRKYCCM